MNLYEIMPFDLKSVIGGNLMQSAIILGKVGLWCALSLVVLMAVVRLIKKFPHNSKYEN